jgi:hypothetical protein
MGEEEEEEEEQGVVKNIMFRVVVVKTSERMELLRHHVL